MKNTLVMLMFLMIGFFLGIRFMPDIILQYVSIEIITKVCYSGLVICASLFTYQFNKI